MVMRYDIYRVRDGYRRKSGIRHRTPLEGPRLVHAVPRRTPGPRRLRVFAPRRFVLAACILARPLSFMVRTRTTRPRSFPTRRRSRTVPTRSGPRRGADREVIVAATSPRASRRERRPRERPVRVRRAPPVRYRLVFPVRVKAPQKRDSRRGHHRAADESPVRPGNRRGFAESDARRREQRRGVSLLATIDRRAFAFAPRDDRVGFVPESVPDDDANDRPVGDGESNVADAAVRAGREAHDVDVRPRADAPFVRAARGGVRATRRDAERSNPGCGATHACVCVFDHSDTRGSRVRRIRATKKASRRVTSPRRRLARSETVDRGFRTRVPGSRVAPRGARTRRSTGGARRLRVRTTTRRRWRPIPRRRNTAPSSRRPTAPSVADVWAARRKRWFARRRISRGSSR